MGSRQYPIWVSVTANDYKSDKSYESSSKTSETVYIGSSSTYSNKFFTRTITKENLSNYKEYKNVIVFKCWIDGMCVKEAIYDTEKHEILETIYHNIKQQG